MEYYVAEKEQNSEKFKLPPLSRQAIFKWVVEGFAYLQSHPEWIEKCFSVCGITTHNPQKVRDQEFLTSVMQNVTDKIHEEEVLLEWCDKDLFYNM